MPRRSWWVGMAMTSRSSMAIRPDVGSVIRLIIRSVVVLPQPEVPTRTVIVPEGISNERSPTATVPSG